MTITVSTPARDDYGSHAVYLDWAREFLPWARGKKRSAVVSGETVPLPCPWRPGGRWALIGPTGEGKSTFAVGILGLRKWVLSLDPKGEDETLEASGYHRVKTMPPPKGYPVGRPKPPTERWIWDQVDKGLPVGLIAGFEALTDDEDIRLHQ